MIVAVSDSRLIWFIALSCLPINPIYSQETRSDSVAANSAKKTSLPDAQLLLDRYFTTTRELNAAQTLSLVGEVSVSGVPVKGTLTMYVAKGGKLYRVIDFPAIGKLEAGSDGTLAWERNFTSPPRIVPKEEAQQNLFGLDPAIAETWKTQFSLETIGDELVDGHACFAVRMTPLERGRAVTAWLDADTGLLVKLTTTVRNSAGDIAVTQIIRDYREEEGIKVPHEFEIVSNLALRIVLYDVKINSELSPGVFELPTDVRALVARESKDGADR